MYKYIKVSILWHELKCLVLYIFVSISLFTYCIISHHIFGNAITSCVAYKLVAQGLSLLGAQPFTDEMVVFGQNVLQKSLFKGHSSLP